MSGTVKNALKAVAVLTVISIVCVGLLTVCNMFFPKYTPVLDIETAKLINGICYTGKTDDEAFENGYIVMLQEGDYGVELSEYNKTKKSAKAEILAVYGEPKGLNAGSYIIESSSAGRDGDIVMLVAYSEGTIVGACVKKQNESYFFKLPENFLTTLTGASGDVDLKGELGKTGATVSLSAINRAVNLSNTFALENNTAIRSAVTEKAGGEA